MSKKDLFWLIFCGVVYSFCILVMGILTIFKLTSVTYWYENLISLIGYPCEFYLIFFLGRLVGRKETKLPIEKLIDEELKENE